ncbi:NAD(P)/FAD-dependent oxidoreductase [Lachnospira pectinoschiza]|uniref:2,4-dienoyl-CoA reductase n=1 Tax=Lachnospira pectinoschiza TaxID=28052 RepID=A0A1G9YCS2_9FIRM|nr:NAD(P)/FAD-dependent oxidoreductase [Lachnospira pectinoschiza]SDN06928.1 2,4-dienoyl-CoA reductase [Lachnospira pectinoschiza]
MNNSVIFSQLKIGKMTVKNRLECAPYGNALFRMDGAADNKQMMHFRNLVRGGVGMVTIGSANCNLDYGPAPVPYMHNPFLLSSYKNMVELAHQYDVRIGWELIGAKEMFIPAEVLVNTYTVDDIHNYQKGIIEGAVNALSIGSDYIMIHGGHGVVPAAFYRESTNKRTDEYGGSFENRTRIIREILEGIREKVGDKLAIEYRISGEEMQKDGLTVEDQIAFAKAIEDYVDIFNISRGVLENNEDLPYVFPTVYDKKMINVENAKKFKEVLSKPVSVVGGNNVFNAEEIINSGAADMVAMVRPFIADPYCVEKFRRGQADEIRPCIRCNNCINQTHGKLHDLRCSVNPLIGREEYFGRVEKKADSKKVLIIGAGPAGLEAARTASLRGHKVILIEKSSELGGNFIRAAKEEFKKDLRNYLDWSIRTVCQDKNIEVRLNTEADASLITKENPDALIIAVGSDPIIPKFSATGTDKLQWVGEATNDSLGENVVVAGGGFTGLEAAYGYALAGKKVTVVDMIDESMLGNGASVMNSTSLLQKLEANKVTCICNTKVVDVTSEGIKISNKDGEKVLPCDNVVLSFGQRPKTALVDELKNIVPETYVIGDCSSVGGTVWQAVRSGFEMAFEL